MESRDLSMTPAGAALGTGLSGRASSAPEKESVEQAAAAAAGLFELLAATAQLAHQWRAPQPFLPGGAGGEPLRDAEGDGAQASHAECGDERASTARQTTAAQDVGREAADGAPLDRGADSAAAGEMDGSAALAPEAGAAGPQGAALDLQASPAQAAAISRPLVERPVTVAGERADSIARADMGKAGGVEPQIQGEGSGGAAGREASEGGLRSPYDDRSMEGPVSRPVPFSSVVEAATAREGASGPASAASGSSGAPAAGQPAAWLTPLAATLQIQALRGIRLALGDGEHEAVINLNPPQLGRLRIRVRVSGERVSARVQAQRPDVGALLGADREVLREGLEEQGLRLEALIIEGSGEEVGGEAAGTGAFGNEPDQGVSLALPDDPGEDAALQRRQREVETAPLPAGAWGRDERGRLTQIDLRA
ncbi:MAG: flagellar hook-length control protein FliK [Candidatus Eisenbacteria bacterium]